MFARPSTVGGKYYKQKSFMVYTTNAGNQNTSDTTNTIMNIFENRTVQVLYGAIVYGS